MHIPRSCVILQMRFESAVLTICVFLVLTAVVSCSGRDAGSGEVTYFDLCRQNLELARQGRLAEDVFTKVQHTSAGLVLDWEEDARIARLLSDIYYTAGHLALARRYAFEANVCAQGEYDPEMLRTLIRTNIIYGSYEVAEKYIGWLEGDRKYGKWAGSQRCFLYDDSKVEADAEYSQLRKCIPEEDFLSSNIGIDDLKYVIAANPRYRNAVEYLGVYYLLDCDFENFENFVEEYYGIPALEKLPRSFAEAVCMMSETNPGYWKRFSVDQRVWNSFRDFRSRLSNGLSMERFKDTFWYYVMMMNTTER